MRSPRGTGPRRDLSYVTGYCGPEGNWSAGFAAVDPGARLPWYGPDMSAASSVTARLMETWAHGQDIADALGVARPPTPRLRHIAHIGVAAMGFSFVLRGRMAPSQPVRVELGAPDGSTWTGDRRTRPTSSPAPRLISASSSPSAATRPTPR